MNKEKIFLRGVWKNIPDEKETDWIERLSKVELTSQPLGDYGAILKDMLNKEIKPETIARLMKIVAYETAFGIMYHLEDPNASYEGFPEEKEKISWGLFIVDNETNEPIEPLYRLHESILSMDPTEREMRPILKKD